MASLPLHVYLGCQYWIETKAMNIVLPQCMLISLTAVHIWNVSTVLYKWYLYFWLMKNAYFVIFGQQHRLAPHQIMFHLKDIYDIQLQEKNQRGASLCCWPTRRPNMKKMLYFGKKWVRGPYVWHNTIKDMGPLCK